MNAESNRRVILFYGGKIYLIQTELFIQNKLEYNMNETWLVNKNKPMKHVSFLHFMKK